MSKPQSTVADRPLGAWATAPVQHRSFLVRWGLTIVNLGWSLLTFSVAVALAIALIPGVSAKDPTAILIAVVVISLLDFLSRPFILALLSWAGPVLSLIAGLATQFALVWLGFNLSPGIELRSASDGFWAVILATLFIAIGRWVIGSGSADTVIDYVLAGKNNHTADSPARPSGLLVVMFDGVSSDTLNAALVSGLAPNIDRWISAGILKEDRWWATVPCTTPASMAGILHGDFRHVPAFRWWDRTLGRLLVCSQPADAAVVEERFDGTRDLAVGGSAISTTFTGGADASMVVMSRATSTHGFGPRGSFLPFFSALATLPVALIVSVGEIAKEIYQGQRQRARDVRPRVRRHGAYIFLRAITNVLQRLLNVFMITQRMRAGDPIIIVDFVDYDEIAHHAGPVRPESMRSLEGLDGVLGDLRRAAYKCDTAYELVIISDHGQSLGETFLQRTGRSLDQVVRELMETSPTDFATSDEGEEWGPLNTIASLLRSRVAPKRGPVALGPDPKVAGDADVPEVAVIASGNLGMVWFPRIEERAGLEHITQQWPVLLPGLANMDGVGIVVAHGPKGPVAFGTDGTHDLHTGKVEGTDPLADYPARAAADLARVASLPDSGDLILISSVTPSGQVNAFEGLVGSHGGLGGEQNHGMLLHSSSLAIDEDLREDVGAGPIITGAWNLNAQLRAWRDDLTGREPAADAYARSSGVVESNPGPSSKAAPARKRSSGRPSKSPAR